MRRALAVQRQLRILPVVLPLAVVLMTIAIVLSVTSTIQLGNVRHNTDRIDAAARALRAAAIKQCERTNDSRRQGNQRADVLREFLESAARAREASGTRNDLRAAARYRVLKTRVRILPSADCQKQVAPIVGELEQKGKKK
jgi:ADP-ribosylglycohydrolase